MFIKSGNTKIVILTLPALHTTCTYEYWSDTF
jgi:hypothetical protein